MNKKLISILMIVMCLTTLLNPLSLTSALAAEVPTESTETVNVALNAQVTSTGQCADNERASFAVDGKTDTKWCDNSNKSNKSLELDLGQVYNINQWVVQNACIGEKGNCPFWNTKDFRLQKSEDGNTWIDVDVVTENAQTIVDRYVPTFSAQYVRLYVDRGAYDNNTVRIFEFELYGVEEDQTPALPATNLAPVDYVDPFINTLGDNGQTNPGPTTPFGLVSLGPDGDGGAFSGYYYEDKYLKGFSHLRFSGVGCSGAGGNILMMPQTDSFTKDSNEYKEKYDKASETASPGYYGVELESGIQVELTASDNVGFHRYTFPTSERDGSVLIDLSKSYAGMIDANLKVDNNREISGMIQSRTVCGHGYYTMYFSISFDQDFETYTSWSGEATGTVAERTGSDSGVWLNFDTESDPVIQAKVGLSPISVEQAKAERDQEVQGWDFDAQHAETRGVWSDLLGKVEITDADETNKTIFYTQLYHSFLHPNKVSSSAGTFRAGRDEQTIRHTSELGEDFDYYNGWTTWDDYRKYSLFSLLAPKDYENMVRSMIDLYKTRGSYAQWGSGYWPSPTVRNEFNGAVIMDAIAKDFDFSEAELYTALQGMAVDTDNYSVDNNQISGKLERAYSAYYPMKLASMIGDEATYEKYRDIAMTYKELWNPDQQDDEGQERGFFTPNGTDVDRVSQVNEFAYQGNLWTYRWFVPHDVSGMAELMGGPREMAIDLQHFFAIDEYVAINEPDLHVPFLFNYLGMPYLTQYYAREFTTEVVTQRYHNHGLYAYPIQSRVYRDDPEGYLQSMDDDAGAMSSWFVYSAMGLFPSNPGDPYYMIGSPIFSEMTLHLDNGKSFTIKANNVSSENRFIQSAELNGAAFDQPWIGYEEIMAGGTLTFEMGHVPNTDWGADPASAPPTADFTASVENKLARRDLIPEQSVWSYYDHGQYAGEGWTNASFDDSSWSSGAAMLGYDKFDNVETKVSYGPDSGNKHTTTYFRKTFELGEGELQDMLQLEASLIRDDGAIVYLNGHEIIRTNMPDGEVGYDTWANGTVNDERDRNVYSIDPAHLVEGRNVISAEVHQTNRTSSDIAFEFRLTAVEKLTIPAAPSAPSVNDEANTFDWTFVPGYEAVADYEFSTDGGMSWHQASAKPQIVGPVAYGIGEVRVRVKADESDGRASGHSLASTVAYTSDELWEVYDLVVNVERTGNLKVDITGTRTGDYEESTAVVFQMMNESEQAWMTNVVPVAGGEFEHSQWFNVNASKYQLNVYLVDVYQGNVYDALWLAEPMISKPETVPTPQPGPGPEPEPEPEKPEPLPIPQPNPEPEQPVEEDFVVEFESRHAWSSEVNPGNNDPLKTEGGHGGTVVANTFDNAWLAYPDLDFGAEGYNQIEVQYAAPSSRVPNDALLEIRLGQVDGDLVGTIKLENTGSWNDYKNVYVDLLHTVAGVQDVYIVMRGSTTSSLPYIGNFDRMTFYYEETRADYGRLELETYDDWSTDPNPANQDPLKTENGQSDKQVANTFDGAWLAFNRMEFGDEGVNQLAIHYVGNAGNTASEAAVEVRLGSVDGTLVGTIATPPTGSGWGNYATVTGKLDQTLTGIHDIYLVFTGNTDSTYRYIGNFDHASFSLKAAEPVGDLVLEFESRSEWSTAANPTNNNPLRTEGGHGGTVVANTFDDAWLAYEDVNFGSEGYKYALIEYDAPSNKVPADIALEIRLGSKDGELLGTIELTTTGDGWGSYASVGGYLDRYVMGQQDVYVVMKGSTDGSLPYIGNFDRMTFQSQPVRTDYAALELESYDDWSTDLNPANQDPLKTENGQSHQQVANTFDGAWISFEKMNFGEVGVTQLSIQYVGNTDNTASEAAVEVRLGSVDGTLVSTIATPPTGSGWGNYATVTGELNQTLTGIHDIYLVFKGKTDSTYKYIGNFDHASFTSPL